MQRHTRTARLSTFPSAGWGVGLLALALLIAAPYGATAQTTLYSEDFASQSAGDRTDDDKVWSLSGTGNTQNGYHFAVKTPSSDLLLQGQNLDGAAVWATDRSPIDISGASSPGFSLVLSERGELEGADYVDVEYSTDGGSTFTLIKDYEGLGSTNHTLEGNFDNVTVRQSGLSGSSLVLRVTMENNAESEQLRLDDVQVTNQTSPTVQFTASGATVQEDDGSTTLTVELQNADGSQVEADVAFQSGASTSSTADLDGYSTTTVSFSASAASGDTKDVSVTLTDDGEQEGQETAEFALTNVSGGEATGGPFALEIVDTEVVINEVLADPPDGSDGDANGDGTRSASGDEFVEIYNKSASSLDLGGFALRTGGSPQHDFPDGTVLDPGQAVVVFGGGTPATSIPGIVQTASGGGLSLTNGGDDVTVRDASGNPYLTFSYGSKGGDAQSLTRDPDFTGGFVKHTNATGANGALFSPGEQVDGSPLPVELAAFRARSVDGGARLTWTTVSETNNAGFAVQHRRGGRAAGWTQVGYVASTADGGTTTSPQSYSYVLPDLSVGTHHFRLRQVDLSGSATVTDSVTVDVQMQGALTLTAPAPNPTSVGATVSFAVRDRTEATLRLYNTLGQRVRTVYRGTPPAAQRQTVRIEATGLASGTYFLRLDAGGRTRTEQITVVR